MSIPLRAFATAINRDQRRIMFRLFEFGHRLPRALPALTGAVLIVMVLSAPLAAQNEPPILPETRVEATPPTADFFAPQEDSGLTGTILDGTLFTNQPAPGYRAPTSTSSSIIALPDADIPGTVSTLTRDLMNDQVTLSFTDVARNAGAVPVGDGLFADKIFIRGLEVGTRNYRKDGFLDPTFVPRDPQNIERIEILKGPSSFLYGSGDPAGIVNIVTKKPIANNPFAVAGFTFGSYQEQRYTLDMNGNVSRSGNVLYRLNVAQEDRNNFVDFDYLNRTDLAPVVTWLVNPSTTLTWNGEWHKDNRIGFQGTPAVNGDPLFLPPNRFVGQPGLDGLRTQEFRQSLVLTHQISDNWSFNIGGYSLFYRFPGSTTSVNQNPVPGFLPPLGGPLYYQTRNIIPFENEQTQSMITNLVGDFYTGSLRHRAVFGMEYVYFDSSSEFISTVVPVPFNVVDPTYSNPPGFPVFTADFPVFRQQRTGGYMQDTVDLNPYWKAIGGVRFDTLAFDFERNLNLGPGSAAETQQTFNRVTPRGGVVYQPFADDTLACYYNYSQSFTPPGGGIFLGTVNNRPLVPILGSGHEAGIKTLLLPGLSLNACGYHIARRNDEFNSSAFTIVQVGEVVSQGAELNLMGTITERWNVTGNYTYSDSRLFDPTLGFNGQNARNIPFNTANLWTWYNFIQDGYRTLGAAIGVYYLGSRAADLQNTLNLPAFSRWDGGLYYGQGRFNANVYVQNLFDHQYAFYSNNVNQVYQGAPLNFRANVGWTF